MSNIPDTKSDAPDELTQEVAPPEVPVAYRFAQAYLALLMLIGGLAAWRVYGLWSGLDVTIGDVLHELSRARLRELPEVIMVSAPIWMPCAMLLGCAWISLLNAPRKWALWTTFAIAVIALLLVFHVDGELHRIERGYYSRSHWVELFWRLARPVQVASIIWLCALPGLLAFSRWRKR